jgi:hypothetical protein
MCALSISGCANKSLWIDASAAIQYSIRVKSALLAALCALCAFGAACSAPAVTPTAAPAAGVVLSQILTDCWGVSQLRELDGTRADHTRAFECARQRLLRMTRDYPDAAEPHRLLAWGYYFALDDEDAARAEYERAAEIYATRGRAPEQAEVIVQLANLAFRHDRGRGCGLLADALRVDPANARAAQLSRNFACPASPTAAPTRQTG